jgi:hypothetical protein
MHVFDESNVEFRKIRVQTWKKILQKLKNVITIEEQKIEKFTNNEFQTFKKSITMLNELTTISSKK